MSNEEYINNLILALKDGPQPDCYLIYKTLPPLNRVVGEPLAIFKTESALRKSFRKIAERTDSKFGITVGACWFDDEANNEVSHTDL